MILSKSYLSPSEFTSPGSIFRKLYSWPKNQSQTFQKRFHPQRKEEKSPSLACTCSWRKAGCSYLRTPSYVQRYASGPTVFTSYHIEKVILNLINKLIFQRKSWMTTSILWVFFHLYILRSYNICFSKISLLFFQYCRKIIKKLHLYLMSPHLSLMTTFVKINKKSPLYLL